MEKTRHDVKAGIYAQIREYLKGKSQITTQELVKRFGHTANHVIWHLTQKRELIKLSPGVYRVAHGSS